jgi:hypothetical protein
MIGGDFNLVRSQSDKSNGVIDFKWADKFNAWVDMWALVEIGLAGRSFTWSNNQSNRIMSRIDRIFCITSFEALFPLGNAKALPRLGSDHTPIVWDSGEATATRKSSFKFEKWWSTRVDFLDVVVKAWSIQVHSSNPLDVWQAKVRCFRSSAKGWSANIDADIRKKKKSLMEEYDTLDIKAESQELLVGGAKRFKQILAELSSFWLIEEIKAKQRSRDKNICEGDRNTASFHALANQRRRKKMIPVLDGPEGPVTEAKEMLEIAKNYYKDLFGAEERPDIRLLDNFFLPEEKVTLEENDMLGSRFT